MLLRNSMLLACVAMSACSVNNYCLVELDYQKAEPVPELHGTDELAMPQSPSALRLPPQPQTKVPFGQRAEDGTGVCLDRPPTVGLPSKASADVVRGKSEG